MVQAALLVAVIGMTAFFLLLPVSIVASKSAFGDESPSKPVEQEIETSERSGRPGQGSGA